MRQNRLFTTIIAFLFISMSHCIFAAIQIVSTSPVQNEMNALPGVDISVTFDIGIDSTSINANTCIIHSSQSGLHTGVYNIDSGLKMISFDSGNNFSVGETVTVILTTSITSISGDTLLSPYSWSFNIKTSNGSRIFTRTDDDVSSVGSNSKFMTAGDLDSDGDVDLAVAYGYDYGQVSILKNDGAGNYTKTSTPSVGSTPYGITSGDYDLDGDLDLAVANAGANSNSISILTNWGGGNYSESTTIGVGLQPEYIISSDLNGDGYLDLAVANSYSGTVSILLNDKTGNFQEDSSFTVGSDPNSLTSGDFNNDGAIDLAVTNEGSNSISILENDGAGNFTVSSTLIAAGEPYSITSNDFNNDGDIDLAVANSASGTVSIFANNGSGSFGNANTVSVGLNPSSIVAADLNADGYLDLAVLNRGSDDASILKNDRSGNFILSDTLLGDVGARDIVSADINADGNSDISILRSSDVIFFTNAAYSPPQNLTAFPVDQGTILHWTQNIEPDLYKYNIYRDESSPATTLIDSVLASSQNTFFTDSSLSNGQMYYYRINAVDYSGNNVSDYSDEKSVTPEKGAALWLMEDFESYPVGVLSEAPGSPWVRLRKGRNGNVSTTGAHSGEKCFEINSYSTTTETDYVKFDSNYKPAQLSLELWYNVNDYYVYKDFAEVGLGNVISKFEMEASAGYWAGGHKVRFRDKNMAESIEIFNELDYDMPNYIRTEFNFTDNEVSFYIGTNVNAPLCSTVTFDGTLDFNAFYITGGLNQTYIDDIYISTKGRYTNSNIDTRISSIPVSYKLSQNFPNPFNPDTEINYDVPEASLVNITVYNLLGQKVKTLVDMQMEPGYHSVKWNGTSDAGLLAGSGVYIVRIVADDFTAIKKMMLMR